MAQFIEIQRAQQYLEECVMRKMDELQVQLQSGSAKDTVAKVAEEFRTFRELTFSMLGLLRKQIAECSKTVDVMETRHRRKSLIFSGLPEVSGENCTGTLLNLLHKSLELKDISSESIKSCHRLGGGGSDNPRPILVRFSTYDQKVAVWRAKTKLKGSRASVKEFLTKIRQTVFGRARQHFGIRGCWTQDGIIVIKAPDGSRYKITSMEELQPLLSQYPKVSPVTSTNTMQR